MVDNLAFVGKWTATLSDHLRQSDANNDGGYNLPSGLFINVDTCHFA